MTASFDCWALIYDGKLTEHIDEFGVGMVRNMDFSAIQAAWKDIFETIQEFMCDVEIPEDVIAVELTGSNLTHQEGQQSFPETGQWDFPPHWEVDLVFNRFELAKAEDL